MMRKERLVHSSRYGKGHLVSSSYRLKVILEIVQQEHFAPDGRQVDEPVEGGYTQDCRQHNSLRVDDSMDLGSRDFMGVCKILGEMHTAMSEIGGIRKSAPSAQLFRLRVYRNRLDGPLEMDSTVGVGVDGITIPFEPPLTPERPFYIIALEPLGIMHPQWNEAE